MKTLLKIVSGAGCALLLAGVFAPGTASADHVRHFAGYDAWGRPVYSYVRVVPHPARYYAPCPPPRYYGPHAGVAVRFGPVVVHGQRYHHGHPYRGVHRGYRHHRYYR